MKLHLWGTDYRRSSSDFRRHLYLSPEERKQKLAELSALGFQDLVYLSTCNRVEFYTTGEDYFRDTRPQWRRLLKFFNLSDDDFYRGYHLEGKSALRHLMRVGSSLESMVIGEPQILGQLKESLQWTKENGFPISRSLEKSFQIVFEVSKRVRTLTRLAEKPVSIASLGIKEIQRWEAELPLKTVAVVGRSPMNTAVIQFLKKERPHAKIVWINRSIEKLKQFEEAKNTELLSLSEFLASPPPFSHMVTATSSADPIFTSKFFERLDGTQKIIFDFAEPPDVETNAAPSCHIRLIKIEDLQNLAYENAQARALAVESAEEMIDESIRDYCLEQKEAPLLKSFSAVEPSFYEELKSSIAIIEKEFPQEVQGKVIRILERVVRRNLHQSRDHLKNILRKGPLAEEEVTIAE